MNQENVLDALRRIYMTFPRKNRFYCLAFLKAGIEFFDVIPMSVNFILKDFL
jgi:hypothetical protein